MGKVKTYIINLPKEKDRKENMLTILSSYQWLDAEFIDAIYGNSLSTEEIQQYFDLLFFEKNYRRSILPGEIGCTLSHRFCYRKFLETNEQVALILEDDIRFCVADDIHEVVLKLAQYIENDKPAIMLVDGSRFWYRCAGRAFSGNYSLYETYDAMLTSGYLINRAAARLMLQENRPGYLADDWRHYIRKGVAVYAVSPSIIRQSFELFDSSITDSQRMPVKTHYSVKDLPLLMDKLKKRLYIRLGLLKFNRE